MKKYLFAMMSLLCFSCAEMDELAVGEATCLAECDEPICVPCDTMVKYGISTKGVDVHVLSDCEIKVDSTKELRDSKMMVATKDGYKFGVAYLPICFKPKVLLKIFPEFGTKWMDSVGESFESMLFGRKFLTQKLEDEHNDVNLSCWSNGELSILVMEQMPKGCEMRQDIVEQFVWKTPERSELSATQRLVQLNDLLQEAFKESREKISLFIEGNVVNIRIDGERHRYSEEAYQEEGHKVVSRLVYALSPFKELADEGYNFRYSTYGDEGVQFCNLLFSADELDSNVEL